MYFIFLAPKDLRCFLDLRLEDNKAILKDALEKMSIYKLGIACIIDENKKFIGLKITYTSKNME